MAMDLCSPAVGLYLTDGKLLRWFGVWLALVLGVRLVLVLGAEIPGPGVELLRVPGALLPLVLGGELPRLDAGFAAVFAFACPKQLPPS